MYFCKNCFIFFETPVNSSSTGRDHYIDGEDCPGCGSDNIQECPALASQHENIAPKYQKAYRAVLTQLVKAELPRYKIDTPYCEFIAERANSRVFITTDDGNKIAITTLNL